MLMKIPALLYVTGFSNGGPFTLHVCVLPNTTFSVVRGQLKCDGTRAETGFRLSAKRTSPFKSAGASVQSTAGSRVVRISGSSAGYTMFRGSVKSTGYPLHSPVSPSLPLPCVTVFHHISTGVNVQYMNFLWDFYRYQINGDISGFSPSIYFTLKDFPSMAAI
jgi:hypothetical protein